MGKRNAEIDEALGKLTIEALTQETLTLRNAYTLMVSEKWEIHRANLTEGKPCPLCGSTTHPYHTDNRRKKTERRLSTDAPETTGKTLGRNSNLRRGLEGAHRPVSKDSKGRGRTEIALAYL